jgi:rhodanese-related sulfurtransferase
MILNNFSSKIFPTLREVIIIMIATLLIAISFNLFRSAGIPLFGFSSETLIKEQQAQIPNITISEAHELYLQKNVIFIDARDPLSFEEGHIDGAINIYPDEVSLYINNLKTKASQGFMFITYCDGPHCPLSKETAHGLLLRGIPKVKVLVNGWSLWSQARYPVLKGKK